MANPLSRSFPSSVRELRFLFCQTSKSSEPLRSFVASRYPDLKAKNPDVNLMVREAVGTTPRAFICYGKGQEIQIPLANANDAADVEKRIANDISKLQA